MSEQSSSSQASADTASTEWAGKKVFTTGEAASLCKVSQQTIIRCFDSGRLSGFRVPGSRFRRIPREELLRFMRENDIPTDALDPGPRRVLVVDDDEQILELFRDAFAGRDRYEVRCASNGYDAGLLTESFRPHLVVLDYMLPDINGNVVCERIRAHADLAATRIILISGVIEPDEIRKLREAGADEFVKKPFNIEQVLERVEQLTEA